MCGHRCLGYGEAVKIPGEQGEIPAGPGEGMSKSEPDAARSAADDSMTDARFTAARRSTVVSWLLRRRQAAAST